MLKRIFTTREYLDLKEQEELDEIFDNAIYEAQKKQLEEMESKEHEDYVVGLITKVFDYETELSLLQSIYKNIYES